MAKNLENWTDEDLKASRAKLADMETKVAKRRVAAIDAEIDRRGKIRCAMYARLCK